MVKDKLQVDEGKLKSESYELVEVPIQMGLFVKDARTEEVFDDKRILLEILNKLDKIEKAVA